MGNAKKGFIVYAGSPAVLQLPVDHPNANFKVRRINPRTGKITGKEMKVKGKDLKDLNSGNTAQDAASVLWISAL